MASHASHTSHDTHTDPHDDRPSYDDINTPVVVMVGVISAILTLLSMMFFQGLYYHWDEKFGRQSGVVKVQTDPTEARKEILKGGDGIKSIEESMKDVISKYGK